MRTLTKIALGIGLCLGAVAGAGTTYLFVAFPRVSAPSSLRLQPTDELRERGRYLAVHLLGCIDCHSERDWTRLSGPLVAGTEGKGGERFGRDMGLPGEIYSSNLTPAGIGRYSDGELARAITEGVTNEGRPLFPIMPYPAYAKLCERDLHAVMVYTRQLAPIDNRPAQTELSFPMNLIVRTIPKPAASRPPCPDPTDLRANGAYLASVAACTDCHTPVDKGTPLPGMDLAGGRPFPLPSGGIVRSSNITPDERTGIGRWDEAMFIARFRALADGAPKVEKGAFNTVMPWTLYGKLSDADLRAIFTYLKTVQPVSNPVERFTP